MIKKTYIITAIIILAILSAALVSHLSRHYRKEKNTTIKDATDFSEKIENNNFCPDGETKPEDMAKNDNPSNHPFFTKPEESNSPSVIEPDSPSFTSGDINLPIPFASQAPTGNWKDPRQQDSCEEASVLMVIKWIKGERLSKEEAEIKLIAISEWEKREYGNFHDTSAKDTLERIIIGYFKYENAHLKNNASLENIKEELAAGNAVIAPMDGQKLNNPYYTAPGPERHMLVIRGYDADKKEFITNDPGTRRGEGYRYNEDHFFSSIRDYPTGYHEPI